MDDDDDQVDEPRQGPPERAALIRERHAAMLARRRSGQSRLPPGVVADRLTKVPKPKPWRSDDLLKKHTEPTPARESGSQTIVKHTSEAKPMLVHPANISYMAERQAAEGLSNVALASILHVSAASVINIKAGRQKPSEALMARIQLWLDGKPIPAPELAPKPERKHPILPGPVLADRIAAGAEMSAEAKQRMEAELDRPPVAVSSLGDGEQPQPQPQPQRLEIPESLRVQRPNVFNVNLSTTDVERLAGLQPGEVRAVRIPAGDFRISDAGTVATMLYSLGASQAGDLVADIYAEVLRQRAELRALRDGVRKLAGA